MAFSSDLAKLVSDQLSRFATLNRHQLAGHVPNINFWVAQVRNALDVLDGYNKRFENLRSGQKQFVVAHCVSEFIPGLDFSKVKASGLRRVPDGVLREARKTLGESAYRFLVRCWKEGFIQETALRDICRQLAIGVDAADLKKHA